MNNEKKIDNNVLKILDNENSYMRYYIDLRDKLVSREKEKILFFNSHEFENLIDRYEALKNTKINQEFIIIAEILSLLCNSRNKKAVSYIKNMELHNIIFKKLKDMGDEYFHNPNFILLLRLFRIFMKKVIETEEDKNYQMFIYNLLNDTLNFMRNSNHSKSDLETCKYLQNEIFVFLKDNLNITTLFDLEELFKILLDCKTVASLKLLRKIINKRNYKIINHEKFYSQNEFDLNIKLESLACLIKCYKLGRNKKKRRRNKKNVNLCNINDESMNQEMNAKKEENGTFGSNGIQRENVFLIDEVNNRTTENPLNSIINEVINNQSNINDLENEITENDSIRRFLNDINDRIPNNRNNLRSPITGFEVIHTERRQPNINIHLLEPISIERENMTNNKLYEEKENIISKNEKENVFDDFYKPNDFVYLNEDLSKYDGNNFNDNTPFIRVIHKGKNPIIESLYLSKSLIWTEKPIIKNFASKDAILEKIIMLIGDLIEREHNKTLLYLGKLCVNDMQVQKLCGDTNILSSVCEIVNYELLLSMESEPETLSFYENLLSKPFNEPTKSTLVNALYALYALSTIWEENRKKIGGNKVIDSIFKALKNKISNRKIDYSVTLMMCIVKCMTRSIKFIRTTIYKTPIIDYCIQILQIIKEHKKEKRNFFTGKLRIHAMSDLKRMHNTNMINDIYFHGKVEFNYLLLERETYCVLSNILLEFVDYKAQFIQKGGLQLIFSHDIDPCNDYSVLFLLKNFVYDSSKNTKRYFIENTPHSYLISFFSKNSKPRVLEQYFNLLRNLFCGCEKEVKDITECYTDLMNETINYFNNLLTKNEILKKEDIRVLIQITYLFVNVIAGNSSWKKKIISNPNLKSLLKIKNWELEVAVIWLTINLSWGNDQEQINRIKSLREYGFGEWLRGLETKDPILVDKVNTALVNLR
ncbi:Armadillo repeat-containing protein 8 [Astathelohania contejeani]|uniref:Armadillo repeat-containing protein 8 n=1 Tax=Astathelohania contejeani TaxID=164912 RepID=A0ABQ7I235_9MICR|nr:Armadillo repeat-containing protein 8 [Thelohania contejeani]